MHSFNRESFEVTVSVPEEGITIFLSFHDDRQEFFLPGGDYQVPAVKLNDGRVMIDLKDEIGHGVPKDHLERLGCAVERINAPVVVSSNHGNPIGERKDHQHYFA